MADFTMKRGTRMSWIITMADDGSGLDLTGDAKIYFAVRDGVAPTTTVTDADAIIALSTETAGISITDGAGRVFEIEVVKADTIAKEPGIFNAGFKWVPDGETEPRGMGDEYTFEITSDSSRAI